MANQQDPRHSAELADERSRRLATLGALHDSEARFRGAFDHASIGMAITNPDGRWLKVNHALCELLGYPEEELVGRTFHSITHPDDVAETMRRRGQVLAGERASYQIEKRLIHKQGHPIWILINAAIVRDEHGAPLYFASQVLDITERKVAERAFQESNARYASNVTNAPGMVYQFVYRADGGKAFTVVSEAARALVGVEPAAILRDPAAIFGLIHPEDRAEFYASGAASRDALAPWSWEGRVILASGEEKILRGASRLSLQPDGSVICDGLIMDVTTQRRTARRLEESEQRYRSLFDLHPDAVFSFDANGVFLSANPACERLSGYAPDALVGQPFAPLIVPEQRDAVLGRFKAVYAGEAQSYETVIIHKSGRPVEIDVTNIPMVVFGRVTGVFGIARDLTTRRALEGQLREAQKMEAVGQLAGGVAHDFNNILTAISGFAELLLSDFDTDDSRRADVEEILQSARRGSGLTRQLLAFSRKQVLQPATLDLNDVVAEIANMLRRLLGATVQLLTLPAASPTPVLADRTQLEQVLINLAVNARDAMPDGGTLTIEVGSSTADPGGRRLARLVVSDDGAGMPSDVAARAFEPFFTTKAVGKGTGLGLATVRGIVEQSGGTIHVDTHEGRGTTFTISLPLAESRAVESAEHPAERMRGIGTVLVAEDEDAVRDIARRVLERAGFRVLVARHGADALAVLAHADAPVDLLLTDVVMPEMGGLELAARAAERAPNIRIILMSGYTDADVGTIGRGERVEGFLSKPFTAESLLEAVRSLGGRGAD
jgi:two-component system, cell cycle sensor histidine kinase and response regulator CckA